MLREEITPSCETRRSEPLQDLRKQLLTGMFLRED